MLKRSNAEGAVGDGGWVENLSSGARGLTMRGLACDCEEDVHVRERPWCELDGNWPVTELVQVCDVTVWGRISGPGRC